MNSRQFSGKSFSADLAGMTRLLLVVLLAPGIVAGALVAGVLALCLLPVLLLSRPSRRGGFAFKHFLSVSPDVTTRQSTGC